MLKGEGKVIEVHVGTVVVTVDIDASGFDGSRAELDESVSQAIIEDIEQMATEGDKWMSTDITVKAMTG